MTRFSKLALLSAPFVLLAAISLVPVNSAIAQTQQFAPSPSPVAPPPEWAPLGVESLGQNATTREDFTLSKPMLQFAQKFLDNSDEETRRVVAGLNGVTVHSYHFREPGLYDPRAVDSIRDQYSAAGWKHMVSAHGVQDRAGITDLWIRFNNAQITNLAVLLAGPRDLNFVSFSGVVRPLDLLHLSGHFGIPRFDTGSFVAAPDIRP